jgi:general stress protein 26
MATDLSVNQDALKTLNDKIKGVKFAMLTTIDQDGTLRSRPMAAQQHDSDGTLWFFTWADSEKVHEIQRDQQVNLTYAKPGDNSWVSVTGTAQLVRDPALMQTLWRPHLSAWFPKGLRDPNLALLKVTVAKAEFWDSPSGIGAAIAILRNTITDNPKPLGDDTKLDISHPASH